MTLNDLLRNNDKVYEDTRKNLHIVIYQNLLQVMS